MIKTTGSALRLKSCYRVIPRSIRLQSSDAKSRKWSITASFRDVDNTVSEPLSESPSASDRFDPTVRYSITQCSSCGIDLQKDKPHEVGYYTEPKNTKKVYQSKKLQYFSALSKVDDEGRKMLGSQISMFESNPHESKDEKLMCLRCHDALHHSVFLPDQHQPMNFKDVMSSVPPKANILHVFSANDFPLSLVNIKRQNVTLVMNKSDLLFGHGSGINKYAGFFKDVAYRLTGMEKKNLFLISSYTKWGVPDLFKRLAPVNYLVGFVNTGKTRLSNMLVHLAQQMKYPGSRFHKAVGSSHFPALTREHIEHEILDKVVVDVPGFLDESGVFQHIEPSKLKPVLSGKKVLVSDLRDYPYITVKGGQCFSAGGLFFLVPPSGSILQVKPIVPGEPWTFSSVSKAKEVFSNPPEAMKKVSYVKPESMDNLVRYVIPPFNGTIDLLVKDIGYVQIKPTGKKMNDELFEVWAPRGVVLGVRETIEHFLSRYLKEIKVKKRKIEHKGKLLRVEKTEKLKMKPKPLPDYKVFSRLYEIPTDCTDPFDEMLSQFNGHLREHGGSFNQWTKDDARDETINRYWIEKV